eukprot:2613740-Prymnesium_polylepis.1
MVLQRLTVQRTSPTIGPDSPAATVQSEVRRAGGVESRARSAYHVGCEHRMAGVAARVEITERRLAVVECHTARGHTTSSNGTPQHRGEETWLRDAV